MWRHYLINAGKRTLYRPAYPYLCVRGHDDFKLDFGLPDELWASQESDPESPLFDYGQIEQ